MLMSLVSVARGQALRVLQLQNMQADAEKVTFTIIEKTKTSLKKLEFDRYEFSENLDVVTCLEACVVATQSRRDTEGKKSHLLISFKSPYNPVTTWLGTLMEAAGNRHFHVQGTFYQVSSDFQSNSARLVHKANFASRNLEKCFNLS